MSENEKPQPVEVPPIVIDQAAFVRISESADDRGKGDGTRG